MDIKQGGGPPRNDAREVLQVAEEVVTVDKAVVTTGRVRVSTRTVERTDIAVLDLVSEEVEVARVPIGRDVEEAPAVRTEGDVTIIPVLEEIMLVETKLVLREELHVRRVRRVDTVQEPIALRRQDAIVEHVAENGGRKPDDV
jgi:stress response protein YsnF